MKTLLSAYFLIIILLLQGCIQAPSNSRKKIITSASTAPSGSGGSSSSSPSFAIDENLYWFTTNKITGTVTLNKNSQDIIYLRGKFVHDFLNAKDLSGKEYYRKQYCMVGNFTASAPPLKQLRVRALPIFVRTSTNAIERLLRIDIPSSIDNSAACNSSTIDLIPSPPTAFSLPEICPTCSGQITTSNLKLFEKTTSELQSISSSLFNMSSVLLKTDLTSNSIEPSSTCSNLSCSEKGFDCCISGQCVKDASEKINASSEPQYTQAKADYASNPLSFINYPQIFYICSNIAHTPVLPTTNSTTPLSDAQKRVYQYSSDWKCINDYTSNGANVFYVNYSNNNFLSTLVGQSAPEISKYTTINCNSSYYSTTKKKLAIACGCKASDSEMSVKCPDWGVVPVYKSGLTQSMSSITDFNCYTPVPENPIGPITNLNVSVPNRSAPHRFYSSGGVNFDKLTGINTTSPGTVQEGEEFYYQDEYSKSGPVNGAYNINSILGQMTIDLSHTIPAKVVNVELGKSYVLTATSGYFTPCTQCAKDSWFQTFSAFPTSLRGVGLQASGYSTSRDTYGGNTTFGNYEDTKFGRACYVPVTMLPLSHKKNANLQIQRQDRLKTQAGLFINGYQRDWYGFNLGALIGSYDGVTWFAIGTGRRTTATSTKLFLALNASYLDLVDRTDTIVNIIPDFSMNIAADYDYDPELSLVDPRQNTAATCQKFHQCETDADCVTQLGWEYACADVSQYKTNWPLYDSEAKELVNQERVGSLFEILQSTISTSNNKKCVYRGAGAPCKRDYSSQTNEYTVKSLTCAPNFYCASLSSSKFNNQIVRSPNELDNVLFGMDTNILGRPLNYVTANKTLASEISTNIIYNSALNTAASSDMGICRPGKALNGNDLSNHQNADASKRTDYISQVGSCDSAALDTIRFVTCPAFDDTLNYVTLTSLTPSTEKQTQNSCGAEAKHSNTFLSAFKSIEGISLLNLQNITQPILAQDACFRRAGSVCHSDLDCGPNKMHEDTVGSLSLSYFGGTEAEKSYWQESLICGQGTPIPALGTSGYLDYKLNENRCCREIGKDFTMYTQGPSSIVPENAGTNINLKTATLSYKDPKALNRYSRYTISKELINNTDTAPVVTTTSNPKPDQWKVINETGSLTCCGGGWIRKFADGTHDWTVKNRLSIETSNFSCLNFRSPLADPNYNNFINDKVVQASYQREYEFFCKSPGEKGCLQIAYQDSANFTIKSPLPYEPSDPKNVQEDSTDINIMSALPESGQTRLDTSPTADPTTSWTQILNSNVPYSPLPYYFSNPLLDTDPLNGYKAYNFFTNSTFDYGVQFYLPAYIGFNSTDKYDQSFIKKVYIKYFYDAPKAPVVYDVTGRTASDEQCLAVINATTDPEIPINGISVAGKVWCLISNAKTQNRPVMIVKADTSDASWKYAGVIIDFVPIKTYKSVGETKTSEPGNPLYYLSKLARMELIGIPQVTYEPLYCNNDKDKLVPGIFKNSIISRLIFYGNSQVYSNTLNAPSIKSYNADGSVNTPETTVALEQYGNSENRFTYQDKLDHAAVFSSKDFTCCTPLGKKTTSATKCCSGFASESICKIPKGTDLNVYFNKFVSSEGVGENEPGGGLTIKGTDEEVDFNPYTGEPKYRDSTYDKLQALGYNYCDGGTIVTGGAFGKFPSEPFSGSYSSSPGSSGNLEDSFTISIVDSVFDQATDANLGKNPFDKGFRWNHHFYCK